MTVTLDDDAIVWLGTILGGPRDPLDRRRPWTRERAEWVAATAFVHLGCGLPIALDEDCRLFCRACRAATLER